MFGPLRRGGADKFVVVAARRKVQQGVQAIGRGSEVAQPVFRQRQALKVDFGGQAAGDGDAARVGQQAVRNVGAGVGGGDRAAQEESRFGQAITPQGAGRLDLAERG